MFFTNADYGGQCAEGSCACDFVPFLCPEICPWVWLILFATVFLVVYWWRMKRIWDKKRKEEKNPFFVLLLAFIAFFPIVVAELLNPCIGILVALFEGFLRLMFFKRILGWDDFEDPPSDKSSYRYSAKSRVTEEDKKEKPMPS